jgi:hypothetical protein
MPNQRRTLKDLSKIKPEDVPSLTRMQLTLAMITHPERSKVGRAVEREWDRRRTADPDHIRDPRDRASDVALYSEVMAKLKVM